VLFRYATAVDKSRFIYDWSGAAEPITWLYGAVIIAAQSAVRCFYTSRDHEILAWGCILVALFCLLFLVAAMTERAATSSWEPPRTLHLGTLFLVSVTLGMGYVAHIPYPHTNP
jgi:hypothetical protein